MKYIVVEHMGAETPIIFEELIPHDFIAKAFNPALIISAGFVKIYGSNKPKPNACCCENAMTVNVYGKSVSLKKESRPEDEELILKALHRHYH